MPERAAAPPRALTIAGSDSGGGAGIEADLKAFEALRVYGMAAITAVTAQNTVAVTAIHDLPPGVVAAQIDAVATDIGVDAAKTGMLSNAGIVEAVAEAVRRNGIARLVVDPVMIAKSGARLLQPDAQEALERLLLPLALVVTPNIPEAEALAGRVIRDLRDIEEAARALHARGPRFVLVKGGHRDTPDTVTDYLFDGLVLRAYQSPRIATRNTHGTGCTLSAAIAAELALGREAPEAVARARAYLSGAIQHALPLGHGHGPLNHGWER